MKKIVFLMALCASLALIGCSSDDFFEEQPPVIPSDNGDDNNGETSTHTTATLQALLNLDVATDATALAETEVLPDATDEFYEDYAELSSGFTEQHTIRIAYNGTQAEVTGDVSSVTVSTGTNASDVIITNANKGLHLILSGETADGSFKIYSEKKFKLTLNGVKITNPTGAAINNQGKRVYLCIADGTENSLTDGSNYTDTPSGEDEKGTFFSEGKVAVSGSGTLAINSKGKHGFVSDDYILFRPGTNVSVVSSSGHAIKTNDGIFIRGGVVNATTSASAAKAFKTDGRFQISGGRAVGIATGGGEPDYDDSGNLSDVSGAAGLKADADVTISGGALLLKATGKGGKGINTDGALTITGGEVRVVTTASAYTYGAYDTKSKGIKADGEIQISGGDIMVKAIGGEGSEGIESKTAISISGGTIGAYTYDDGINADNDLGSGDLIINDGFIYCYATNNDGIDANGNLTINGGTVIGMGGNAPEEGLDAAEGKTLAIHGGTVIGLGGGGEALSGSQQKAAVRDVSVSAGQYLTVSTSGGNVFALQVPRSFSRAMLQVSSPAFSNGSTFSLGTASGASGDSNIYGYIPNATLSGTTLINSAISTSTTTSGSMGGGPGGGGGGRPGGPR